MERPSLSALFIKYLNNECTPAEVDQLMELLENDTPTPEMESLLQNALSNELEPVGYTDPELRQRLENRLGQIMQQTGQTTRSRRIKMTWAMAAAVVIMLIGTGAWYFLLRNKPERVVAQQKPAIQNDALPGDNRAILTLADGSKVVLDSASNGLLAKQGNSVVNKTADGQLKYEPSIGSRQSAMIAYNTLATPRGGQYQLVLPDGSKVWLNAASSIRYPTAFAGNERKVEITGEAYFEIEKVQNTSGQRIPFKVAILPSTGGAGGGLVEVLGTHFNINAYDDEPTVNTTLLEGRVKVSSIVNRESSILKPGEQAVLSANSPLTIHHSPNLEQVMAWKNQLFKFDNDDLQKVMRQLARWYDVDVVYDRNVSLKEKFAGEMQRSLKLSQVLKGLEGMNVHFKIEGRHLIVLP